MLMALFARADLLTQKHWLCFLCPLWQCHKNCANQACKEDQILPQWWLRMLPLQDGIAITLLSFPAWLLSLHTLFSQNCCCICALFSPVPTLPQRSLYRLLLGCQGTQNCSRQTGKNMRKLTKVCKLVQKLPQTWLLAVPRISRRRGKAAIAQSCPHS